MNFDVTHLVLFALSGACACLGWFARQMWGAVQELKKDMADLRVQISRDYVPYDRLQDALTEIKHALVEIKQSLKDKVDK